MITTQVHDKFKVFVGQLAPDQTIGKLAEEVAGFAKSAGVAAKSIGVEYLESHRRLLITLGYRDDTPGYSIQLHSVKLGKIDTQAGSFERLEKAMGEAAGKLENIICHELYLTEGDEFVMVFMTHGE